MIRYRDNDWSDVRSQPELVTDWGSPFYGKAETITGDVWWYISAGGERIALRPARAASNHS